MLTFILKNFLLMHPIKYIRLLLFFFIGKKKKKKKHTKVYWTYTVDTKWQCQKRKNIKNSSLPQLRENIKCEHYPCHGHGYEDEPNVVKQKTKRKCSFFQRFQMIS